jgi:hypothetical protein
MVRIANPFLWPTILNHTKHASGNLPQQVTLNVRWYYWAKRAFIFADNDPEGRDAATRTFDHLNRLLPTKAILVNRPGADQADRLV